MQGTSSCLWRFNPLLLKLHREISLSLLCLHSSRGSALDLDPPLCVGHPLASLLHPDRKGLKDQLIWGLWLTLAWGRAGYAMRGESAVAKASVTLQQPRHAVFLPRKFSLDHGTLAVEGCTGCGRGDVDSDLCLHTGFLVAAAATLAFHACLWCLR